MRFGVSTWMWVCPFTDEDLGLLKKISDMGLTAVEIPIELEDQFDAEMVGSIVADLGLSCSVVAIMNDDRDPIHPDPQIQQNGLRYLRHCADTLAMLGGGPISSTGAASRPVMVP